MIDEDNNRLHQMEAREKRDDSLVGSWFLSDYKRGWQGCVLAEVAPSVYLVETFGWAIGDSYDQRLVRLEDMLEWSFYDTNDWMNNAYKMSVDARWERERKEATAAAECPF